MRLKFSPQLFLLFMAVTVVSCTPSDKKEASAINQFQEYISGVTSGAVKRSGSILIKFTSDVVSEEQLGSTVSKSVLGFNPAIDGTARWVNRDAIEFTPSSLLEWDTEYKGTLNLHRLIKVPDELNKFVFTFQTPPKQLVVNNQGLSISGEGEVSYRVKGVVETSDEFISSDIEKIFTAIQHKKKITITWDHHPKACRHQFTLSGIERKDKETEISLQWDGSKIGIKESTGQQIVKVPSINVFKISTVRVVNKPDQYVEVLFSDPVNTQMDFRGLVIIDNQPVQQFKADNNVLKIYPASRLNGMHTITLLDALESSTGKKLSEKHTLQINFGGLKPEVKLLGNGVIVPQSEGLWFPFEAVSLSAVDVRITKIFTNNILSFLQDNDFGDHYRINHVGRIIHRSKIELTNKGATDLYSWNAFNIDLSKLITIETGAIYHVEIGFRKSYSLFNCENPKVETYEFVPIEEEDLFPDKNYSSVFYGQYYDWMLRDDPCSQAYYSPDRFIYRNILGSNFGMIAKVDKNGKTYVYITNLLTAKPEGGASVEFYDFQNQLMTPGVTNSDGMLAVQTESQPFLLVAKKDKSIGYLKIENGTLQSTSQFDVSGNRVEKGLKGFIFGERGVWRPGDSIFVSFILEDKQQTLPKGHPLVLEVYNPRGQFVKKMVGNRDERYIYPFFFKTNPEDPTGNWQVILKVGAVSFSKSIRVETVKPNRLKVELNFEKELLSAQRSTKGTLQSKWLHGAPASGLKARVDVSFSSCAPAFQNYKTFDFSTPYNNFYGQEITLFDQKLDNDGKADITFDFKPNKEVNGFLKAAFTTKVFETGGNFSINYFSKPFSPYKDYIGLKIDWSYKSWNKLNNDEDHVISIATVNEQGNPVGLNGVEVKLYELEYRWWYDNNFENLASYAGKTYHKPVFQTTISTREGKGSFAIKRNEDRWGRHLLLVTSPNGHTAGQIIYFDWAWGRSEQKGGPQMLALITEKDEFKTGEEVTVSFPANNNARALITFENGSGIIGQEWLSNLSDFTHYKFKATPEMAPNIYVHVTLIQPHGQTANDLPIRLYGVTPVRVEDPATRLLPKLDMPDEIRPLHEFTIKIREENKRAMDYMLAIVDEGLLDLTNFKTPDPWSSFFAREALGVKTYDLYSYVMGSFGSRLESMFAVGGSDVLTDNPKKKSERFKPVVKVLGPFHLAANSKATHKIILPQYAGSVRIMVVAAGNGQFGNAEKTVPVREPLMVFATFPRVLSPGETVGLPVTLFAMKENIKNVKVKITTNEFLQIQGSSDTTVTFDEIGEKDLVFNLKSADKTGIARAKVEVSSGSEKSFYEIELDIRQPNLPTIETKFKTVKPGDVWNTSISAFGIEGSNAVQLEVSAMPPLNLGHRLKYLIHYPHGCVEQITSSVFPQVYLPKIVEMAAEEQSKISYHIGAGIEKLQRYQNPDGGFGYWPGSSYSNNWSSCYTGHFLLEADNAGYLVPGNLKKNWLGYLRKKAADFTNDNHYRYNEYTQAYRLFLLARAGEPQISAMNRLQAEKELDNQTRWMLAGAYAYAGMKEAAYKLIDFRNMKPDQSYPQCYGSYLREQSIILQTLVVLNETDQASKLAVEISEQLSSQNWLSTQSTAFALIALSNFSQATGAGKSIEYRLTVNGKTENLKNKNSIQMVNPVFNKEGIINLEIENKGEGSLFVNLSNEGAKPGLDTGSEEKGLQLIAGYTDKQQNKIDPTRIRQGDDFITRVSVYNKTGSRIDDLALSQLFPSGWEIINSRLFETVPDNQENSTYDYQDIRDDRVYTYFSMDAYETKTFVIHLNATYKGEYLLSPVTCSAMYNNAYYAKVPGQKVNVVKE